MAQAVIELDDMGYDTSFILNTDKPTGIGITAEHLTTFFYSVCPMFDDDGKHITLSKSNTKQAAKFFDDVRNYLASQWGIHIPEPDIDWKEKSEKG